MIEIRINFKRILAFLLFLTVVVSTFTDWLVPVTVKADSNDRRKTYIELMHSKSITELSDMKTLDNDSLRAIALVCSNAYIPWSTTLDSDAKDAEKSVTHQSMIKILTEACGFEEDSAEFLVENTIKSTLETAKPLYIRYDVYKKYWKFALDLSVFNTNVEETKDNPISMFKDALDSGDFAWQGTTDDLPRVSLWTLGNVSLKRALEYAYGPASAKNLYEKVQETGDHDYHGLLANPSVKIGTKLYKKTLEAQLGGASIKDAKDHALIPITYATMLGIMGLSPDLCYHGYWGTTSTGKGGKPKNGYLTVGGTQFSNVDVDNDDSFWGGRELESGFLFWKTGTDDVIKNSNAGKLKKATGEVTGDKITDAMLKRCTVVNEKPPLCNFYWAEKDGEDVSSRVVWSNSKQCVKTYALLNDELCYESGVGSAICSVNYETLKSAKINSDEARYKTLAWGNLLYVDWVGDIIVDDGVDRFIIVPGCANPYTFSSMKDGETIKAVAAGKRMNAINVFALYNLTKNRIVCKNVADTQDDEVDNETTTTATTDDSGDSVAQEDTDSVGTESATPNTSGTSSEDDNSNDGGSGADYQEWFNYKYKIKYYRGTYSLFNLTCWRVEKGKSNLSLDAKDTAPWQDGNNSYTVAEFLGTLAKNKNYGLTTVLSYTPSEGNEDKAAFPNWSSLALKSFNTKSVYGVLGGNEKMFNTILAYDSDQDITDDFTLTDYFKTGEVTSIANELSASSVNINFSNIMENDKVNANLETSSAKALMQSLFLTYSFAYFNADSDEFKEENNFINLKFEKDRFPTSKNNLDLSTFQTETTNDKVLSFVYYLLHPTEGVSYVSNLIKNKLSGFLLDQHDKMAGASSSNYTTGTTAYQGISSYTTLPSLYDVSWVAKLLDMYSSIIIYLIILMGVLLLCYVLVGSITLQRGFIGVVVFGVLAFLPPIAINSATELTNKTSDKLFSNKFDYWALCQLESYINELEYEQVLEDSGDKSGYLAQVLKHSDGIMDDEGATSFSSVKLKWMSPKRYNSTSALNEAMNNSDNVINTTSAVGLKNQILNSIANSIDRETYVKQDEGALYLYRDYSDIYRYASTSYNLFTTFNYGGRLTDKSEPVLHHNYYIGDINNHQGSIYRWWGHKANTRTAIQTENGNLAYYVRGNYKATKCNGVFKDTSGYVATQRGFLYPNYNINEATNYFSINTNLGAGLLLNFGGTIDDIHNEYVDLQNLINGTTKIDFDKKLQSESDVKDVFNDKTLIGLNNNRYEYFIQTFTGLQENNGQDLSTRRTANSPVSGDTDADTEYMKLSDYYYQLYSESPFYYFNNVFRDQVVSHCTDYSYDYKDASTSSNVYKIFTDNQQEYFYNKEETAGDGYGELRDFMNMHDFFYYVIPALEEGTDLVRDWDKYYKFSRYEGNTLKFTSSGGLKYQGIEYTDIMDLLTHKEGDDEFYKVATKEELYEIWHDYNTYAVANCYSTWLDAMKDCKYSKAENIEVAGEKFKVENPLSPYSYFETDTKDTKYNEKGEITAGRYMVFSRSEMKYYGISWKDLTTVEKKIITLQDNVYKKSIDLMNYYTLKDEVLIQGMAMLELFEFNNLFSEESLYGTDYILYPTSYELKTFSYDAYLRLILAEASGEPLQTKENTSLYQRISSKSSIFFSIFLLLNDILAVYAIPGLKLLLLIVLFLTSIVILVSAAVKLEMRLHIVLWQCLLRPLLLFCAVSLGTSALASLFMSNGAQGVYETSSTISLGDPTMTLIVMGIINGIAVFLYFKNCIDSIRVFITHLKALTESATGAVVGAVQKIGSGIGNLTSGVADSISSGNGIQGIRNRRQQLNEQKETDATAQGVKSTNDRGRDNLPRPQGNDITKNNNPNEPKQVNTNKNKYNEKAKDSSKVNDSSKQDSNTNSNISTKQIERPNQMSNESKDGKKKSVEKKVTFLSKDTDKKSGPKKNSRNETVDIRSTDKKKTTRIKKGKVVENTNKSVINNNKKVNNTNVKNENTVVNKGKTVRVSKSIKEVGNNVKKNKKGTK